MSARLYRILRRQTEQSLFKIPLQPSSKVPISRPIYGPAGPAAAVATEVPRAADEWKHILRQNVFNPSVSQ